MIRPWRRTGALGLDGKFVIAGLLALVADTFLNAYAYLFAWNANNVNRGSWAAFMPLHNPASPTRFAEDLLWAPGMYMYFCAGIAILGCQLYFWLSSRLPQWSLVAVLAVVFVAEFAFDFVMENTVIRLTHAYSYEGRRIGRRAVTGRARVRLLAPHTATRCTAAGRHRVLRGGDRMRLPPAVELVQHDGLLDGRPAELHAARQLTSPGRTGGAGNSLKLSGTDSTLTTLNNATSILLDPF